MIDLTLRLMMHDVIGAKENQAVCEAGDKAQNARDCECMM
jgi:hypothetical protein